MSTLEIPSSGNMEVLLLQDVNGIGKKNDLLVVGDGFALNFLLPHRKALVATPTVRRRYSEQIKRRAEEKVQEKEIQESAASAVAGKTVTFTRKVTKTGKLYAHISEEQIAEALKEQHEVNLSSDAISISETIKALGTFTVQVQMGSSQHPLKVQVNQLAAEGK